MRKLLPVLVIAATAGLAAAAIEWLPETLYFPRIEMKAAGGLRIVFMRGAHSTRAGCEVEATAVAAAMRSRCPACKVTAQCRQGLTAAHRKALSGEALAVAVARSRQGLAVTFDAPDPRLALVACRVAAAQTVREPAAARLACFAPGETAHATR